ncbi:MAG: hypothetical protein JWP91_467 [Fibrobacteres bacterium]|nr:hypothetical protein [Fibrobacterota bacterium]
MKRILTSLLFAFAFWTLDGCVMDTKTGDAARNDSTQVTATGARKPRTPKVAYTAFDSLVYITILGSGPGEENQYWIHRDGKLLEAPNHRVTDTGTHVYVLRDSLTEAGTHTYDVQYGRNLDSLSDKSPDYAYAYAGHSRSGQVRLSLTQEQLVMVGIYPPRDEVISFFVVERKVGSRGKETALDTVELASSGFPAFLDTSLVAEDSWVFYRVRGVDAISETPLPASPWDSIQLKNSVWKYLPSVDLRIADREVQATLANPLSYTGNGISRYFLYRNSTSAKAGAIRVDSMTIAGQYALSALRDQPDSGDYFYWVDARDPWGRVSARSAPKAVHFSGHPMGPDIGNIQVNTSLITIQPVPDPEARFYILERAQDTAKDVKVVDTLPVAQAYPFNTYFTDRPIPDGFYYYRIASLRISGERTDPGRWRRSDFFHFNPLYITLDAVIVNRGDRVQSNINRSPDYFHVLYRSKSPGGLDTLAVDTLEFSNPSSDLEDIPPPGIWYYRVVRYLTAPYDNGTVYRSVSTRIEFTGKPVGPSVVSLTVYAMRIDIGIIPDPDGLAVILERSADGKDWTAADTVSSAIPNYGILRDRPPTDGFWNYRARTVRKDMSVTEPGTSLRTSTAFTFGTQYANTLNATIENRGTRVECAMNSVYYSVLYLMRSAKPGWADGSRVDSLRYPYAEILNDTPAKGVYYYWVQREPEIQGQDGPIYRSQPVKIEFTGSPEITGLTKGSGSVQIAYPGQSVSDTVEIYRSAGAPDDLKSFALLAAVNGTGYAGSYNDNTVGNAAVFYHYRLAVIRGGVRSELGAVKSIFYDPAPPQGISQGLIKQAGGL